VLYIFVGAESENHPSPHCTGIKECFFYNICLCHIALCYDVCNEPRNLIQTLIMCSWIEWYGRPCSYYWIEWWQCFLFQGKINSNSQWVVKERKLSAYIYMFILFSFYTFTSFVKLLYNHSRYTYSINNFYIGYKYSK
jgi:hypothetical protein